MEKLELKHLAPYLPYGLKFSIQSELYPNITMTGLNGIFIYGNYHGTHLSFEIEKVKPILHPLSDLTKYREDLGFVPIIELYRLSNEYNYNNELDYEFIDSWGAKGNILKVFRNRQKDEYTEFIYSNGSFRKDARYSEGSHCFGMNLPHPIRCHCRIYNQDKLRQKLFEWHFDTEDLIGRKLAIDVNTL